MGKLRNKQQSIEIGYLGIHLACKACQSQSIQKETELLNLPIFKNYKFYYLSTFSRKVKE